MWFEEFSHAYNSDRPVQLNCFLSPLSEGIIKRNSIGIRHTKKKYTYVQQQVYYMTKIKRKRKEKVHILDSRYERILSNTPVVYN